MKRKIQLPNGFRLRQLSCEDLKAVQKLCEECTDYYLLHDGTPPTENAAEEIFSALPPGKTDCDKFVFFIDRCDGNPAGIIDLVRDYPVRGEWMLGLLLLSPDERGNGTGKSAHKALTQWAKSLGAKSFRIGVIAENEKGIRFWESLGYTIKKDVNMEFQTKTHQVHVMTLQV